jgi:molecular chaperone GrpE
MRNEDIERILADFRGWLERQPDEPAESPAETRPVDLTTIVREFTALRQEVNLQTRASRTQLEQNAELLAELRQALEPDAEDDGEPEPSRPLLKALVEARDALGLAREQLERTLKIAPPPRSAWSRWFGPADDSRQREALEAVAAGYAMSLARLDRALEQHGFERIACAGLPFDPETMEAVDAVKEPGRTGSEVLAEIRPGYRLDGRLYRAAQVRVARPA